MDTQALHPIGYVSRASGLSTHTIRAWENRYGAVRPIRSSGNQRLYSQEDIYRLVLMRRATKSGYGISHIAGLDTEKLEQLADRELTARRNLPAANTIDARSDAADRYVEKCLTAVAALDENALELSLERAAVELPRMVLLSDVIVPVMREVGRRWSRGTLKVVNEHLASNVIQFFLWDLLRTSVRPGAHPTMVVAAPVGQWCQVGALMAAVVAADQGLDVHFLGANLPAEEIITGAEKLGAAYVALSITVSTDTQRMKHEVAKIGRHLPDGVRLLIGGRASESVVRDALAQGAQWFYDLSDLQEALQKPVFAGSGDRF